MRPFLGSTAVAALAVSASFALAQSEQDHASHHPDAASAASSPKKAPSKVKSKTKTVAPAASSGMGTGMGMNGGDMKQMHDDMHKPGGTHYQRQDKMSGKNAQMMGAMPAAPAASN